MVKVLAWGDYCATTGFGNVASHIMQAVNATGEYDIDVCAINYDGSPYDTQRFPGTVYPARSHLRGDVDVYGRQTFIEMVAAGDYDIVFILHDPQVVTPAMRQLKLIQKDKGFRIIYYFPVDAPLSPLHVELAVKPVEFAVTYTEYAAAEVHKLAPELPLNIFYHGTSLEDFHSVGANGKRTAREEMFGKEFKDKFIISNINSNSYRKDIPRSFMLLNELRRRGHDNVVMYLHMERQGKGGDLVLLGRNFGLQPQKDFLFPADSVFESNDRVPLKILNMLYNLSDCVFTTTRGEGWGLSVTEAMATKTPVVAPGHTSLAEILADERGYLARCGATASMYDNYPEDNRLRPLADVTDMADKIELIKNGDLPDVEEAWNWVKHNSWENIGKYWVGLFAEAVWAKEIKDFVDPLKNPATQGAKSSEVN